MSESNFYTLFTSQEGHFRSRDKDGGRTIRFLRKMEKNIIFFYSYSKNNVTVAETHFLTYYRLFYLVCWLLYAEPVGVVTSDHVTKMAVIPFDPQLPKTPCYTQTSRLYVL